MLERDRDARINSEIAPKRSQLLEEIESLMISLYAKGMSNVDIEE